MVEKVLVYPNETRDAGYARTKEVIRFLQRSNVKVCLTPEDHPALSRECAPVSLLREEEKDSLDLSIVLGGDGTMIRCVHYLLGTGVPIIGINLGTLGYMTEIEPSEIESSLEKALAGQFTVENRLMLEATVENAGGRERKTYYAVNDMLVHRDLLDGILTIKAYINQGFMAEFRADGVIISSPCGSTAYNYSAGGPILAPEADNLILTPLCSHAMLDRSIVTRGDDTLSFYIGSFTRGDHASFSADGYLTDTIGAGTWIHVKKSRYTFPFAKVGTLSFYEIMQKKMRP